MKKILINAIALIMMFSVGFIFSRIPFGKIALINFIGYLLCYITSFIAICEIVYFMIVRKEKLK